MKHSLDIGSVAPDFDVVDSHGKKVHLYSLKSKYVLVVFLRYAGCPWCNLAVHRLAMENELIKKNNCEIIAFIQSTPENIEESIYKRHAKKPKFPLIPDQKRRIYELYDVRPSIPGSMKHLVHIPSWVKSVRKYGYKQTTVDGDLFLVPAYFLISTKTKEIIDRSYSADFYEHDTFTRIYDKINTI